MPDRQVVEQLFETGARLRGLMTVTTTLTDTPAAASADGQARSSRTTSDLGARTR